MNEWYFSRNYLCPCKIIEEQNLWGQTICQVWLPDKNIVVRVHRSDLQPISKNTNQQADSITAYYINYIASASKIAEVLEKGTDIPSNPILLAPMEANVIPLPHQIQALSRAISGDRIRYLLADEVGLGKTIEAGLILRELKLRGKVKRVLVLAPKSLAMQWISEMRIHFNETLQHIQPGQLQMMAEAEWHHLSHEEINQRFEELNPWKRYEQVVVTHDSVKPLERRRSWSKEKLETYNRMRFEGLIGAGWDLIIVDEAHRLGGATNLVARYKLGQGLSEAAPYILLLSATPHQGKSDAFHRLLTILDEKNFPDLESVTKERVADFVIRTDKRKSVDGEGKLLFRPRVTNTLAVEWADRVSYQKLYEEVTEYVRDGFNMALKDRKPHIGFLMVLLQRLVTSSTRAIRSTLERRLELLKNPEELQTIVETVPDTETIAELDGEEQLSILTEIDPSGLTAETARLVGLISLAKQCESGKGDPKLLRLVSLASELRPSEQDVDLKILLFTEFIATQEMLQEELTARGFSVVCLNGALSLDQRRIVQKEFREQSQVLISTDAGGEGLNLQFCHIIINYDLPWNPMKIEQRIGRVDRIGQTKIVKAFNFLLADSVEHRVREVLENKLDIILSEFGVDKTSDVLESAHAGEIYEDALTSAIFHSKNINQVLDTAEERLRSEIKSVNENSILKSLEKAPDMQLFNSQRDHPLPHWVEKMTVSYLLSHAGKVEENLLGWNLTWPNGFNQPTCTFLPNRASETLPLLSLEEAKILDLCQNLPFHADGLSITKISLPALPTNLQGTWALFELCLTSQSGASISSTITKERKAFFSLFLDENNNCFLPTAKHIWSLLMGDGIQIVGTLENSNNCSDIIRQVTIAAESVGQDHFNRLSAMNSKALEEEEARLRVSFQSKKQKINSLGLSEVKQYRLKKLKEEEDLSYKKLQSFRNPLPILKLLLILKVEPTLLESQKHE